MIFLTLGDGVASISAVGNFTSSSSEEGEEGVEVEEDEGDVAVAASGEDVKGDVCKLLCTEEMKGVEGMDEIRDCEEVSEDDELIAFSRALRKDCDCLHTVYRLRVNVIELIMIEKKKKKR
jgi:hypothetical protein